MKYVFFNIIFINQGCVQIPDSFRMTTASGHFDGSRGTKRGLDHLVVQGVKWENRLFLAKLFLMTKWWIETIMIESAIRY